MHNNKSHFYNQLILINKKNYKVILLLDHY